jgi:hypothetical protein
MPVQEVSWENNKKTRTPAFCTGATDYCGHSIVSTATFVVTGLIVARLASRLENCLCRDGGELRFLRADGSPLSRGQVLGDV